MKRDSSFVTKNFECLPEVFIGRNPPTHKQGRGAKCFESLFDTTDQMGDDGRLIGGSELGDP